MRRFSVLIPLFGASYVVAALYAAVAGSVEATARYAFAGYIAGSARMGRMGLGVGIKFDLREEDEA